MKAVLAFLCLGLLGCASMRPSEKAFVMSSFGDLGTTYYAVEHDGAVEVNPVLLLAGDDAATVVLTSAALTVGWFYFVRWIREHSGDKKADRLLWLGTSVRAAATGWNLRVIVEGE